MKCIYCNSQTDLTVSDIISYAITGAKLRKQFVCHTHNALTNDRYEKEFIKELDFFRNQLGFLTRSGEPIQFSASLTVDGKEMHKVRMSDRKSLYDPKGVVTGYSETGRKIYFGPSANISKIPSISPQSVDISNVTLHTTISSDAFVGEYAVHSIAKMAYEWHCYINQIEEFKPEYNEIVDYILNDVGNNIVSIVVDDYYYGLVDYLSNFGSNALFEYEDVDGYKYVVFTLWNAVAYKVRICKSSATKVNRSSEMLTMYLYHIDGTQETKPFGAFSLRNAYAPCFVTVHPTKITIDEWSVFAERLTCLLRTTVMSIHSLKKKVDELDQKLRRYESGRIDIAQLLSYEDTTTAMLLFILDELHKNAGTYDETKSFNSNLASILSISGDTVTKTEEDKKAILISLVEMDKLGTLATYLRDRVKSFNAIYNKEIIRNTQQT